MAEVVIRGNLLYDSVTGHRFFAKGVAYNPRNGNYGVLISWTCLYHVPGMLSSVAPYPRIFGAVEDRSLARTRPNVSQAGCIRSNSVVLRTNLL